MFLLDAACGIWRAANGEYPRGTKFKIDLVSLTKKPLRFPDGAIVHPTISIAQAVRPDLILIPAVGDNFQVEGFAQSLEPYSAFLPWIRACAAGGARVVSVCTGAFLLAATGLLDGRNATTHWLWADEFRKTYPKVKLHPEKLIVDEGNIITSGAATSFNDLVMYLIELYCGYEAAVFISKLLAIDLRRRTQLPYTIFFGQKSHNDRHVLQIQQVIESDNGENWTSESLAKKAGMSLRNFHRRFRKATGEAPLAYIQKIRIEKAKRLLSETNDTVEEIADKIGYKDSRSFRRLFHNHTALSPKAYRMNYGIPTTADSRRKLDSTRSARAGRTAVPKLSHLSTERD
jgi:transcriptional regulator GlxA family with amidase domain